MRFKFRRQHPIPPYIVDFICLERGLIVELDGGQHQIMAAEDCRWTRFLEQCGYRVIRFWNDQVLKQTAEVLEEIIRNLNEPSPSP
jgi:very-short-patch-repair endonuclease